MGYARTGSETSGWRTVKRIAIVTSILTSVALLGRYTLDCGAMFFGANKGEYEQPLHPPLSPKGRFYSAELENDDVMTQNSDINNNKNYRNNPKDGSLFDFSRESTLAERVYNTFQYGRDAIDALANANVQKRDFNRGNPSSMENNRAEKSGLEKKVQPDAPLSNPSYQQPSQSSQQPQIKTTTGSYNI